MAEDQISRERLLLDEQWTKLQTYEKKLERRKQRLREEWRHLDREREYLRRERKAFDDAVQGKWDTLVCSDMEKRVKLNIGGQDFEATARTLSRDPFSLLAAICQDDSPIKPQEETNQIFIDRDWWLFRYILNFLRSNVLPDDPNVLKELLHEASYFRLELLRRAIDQKFYVLKHGVEPLQHDPMDRIVFDEDSMRGLYARSLPAETIYQRLTPEKHSYLSSNVTEPISRGEMNRIFSGPVYSNARPPLADPYGFVPSRIHQEHPSLRMPLSRERSWSPSRMDTELNRDFTRYEPYGNSRRFDSSVRAYDASPW